MKNVNVNVNWTANFKTTTHVTQHNVIPLSNVGCVLCQCSYRSFGIPHWTWSICQPFVVVWYNQYAHYAAPCALTFMQHSCHIRAL